MLAIIDDAMTPKRRNFETDALVKPDESMMHQRQAAREKDDVGSYHMATLALWNHSESSHEYEYEYILRCAIYSAIHELRFASPTEVRVSGRSETEPTIRAMKPHRGNGR